MPWHWRQEHWNCRYADMRGIDKSEESEFFMVEQERWHQILFYTGLLVLKRNGSLICRKNLFRSWQIFFTRRATTFFFCRFYGNLISRRLFHTFCVFVLVCRDEYWRFFGQVSPLFSSFLVCYIAVVCWNRFILLTVSSIRFCYSGVSVSLPIYLT